MKLMSAIVTLVVVLGGFLFLIGWDIYQGVRYGYYETISFQVFEASSNHPIIPAGFFLILGVIIGHVFWPQCPELLSRARGVTKAPEVRPMEGQK
jgi:hypothetical protein